MTRLRVSGARLAQRAISSSVRPQPEHSPVAASITQTLMQGVSIAPNLHIEDAKLVAVGIAEIGAVEIAATQAGGAFIRSTAGDGLGVHLVDHFA